MSGLVVRRWSIDEFLANRVEWQRLLARSEADPLFMSWDWMSAWWRHHAGPLGAELRLLALYSVSGELSGIAPFYAHRGTHRGVVRARRLELLGTAWRDGGAVFSEYLDLIAATGRRDEVCAQVRAALRADPQWDELLLCNLRERSLAAQLADALREDTYVRPVESLTGWSIALPGSFDAFAARLSSNTRRKVIHQRDKLAGLACAVVSPAERPAALERLERFVARRWGGPPADARAHFHAGLLERFGDDGTVRLTELRAAGHCISVMLNLRVGATDYYLQSGFDADRAHGTSPGYLHLGFAIEAACRDGLRRFDFLAGRGLHRDYKRDFAAESAPLQSLHVVRRPLLRALFRAADTFRGRRTAAH